MSDLSALAATLSRSDFWSLQEVRDDAKKQLFALLCQAMRNEPEDPSARAALAGFTVAEEAITTTPCALDDLVFALNHHGSAQDSRVGVRNAMLCLVEASWGV